MLTLRGHFLRCVVIMTWRKDTYENVYSSFYLCASSKPHFPLNPLNLPLPRTQNSHFLLLTYAGFWAVDFSKTNSVCLTAISTHDGFYGGLVFILWQQMFRVNFNTSNFRKNKTVWLKHSLEGWGLWQTWKVGRIVKKGWCLF